MSDPTPDVLGPEGTAAYLKLSLKTVYTQLQSGEIPGHKFGRNWRVSKSALDRLLAGDK